MVSINRVADLEELTATAAAKITEVVTSIQSSADGGVNKDGYAHLVLTGGTAGIQTLKNLAECEGIDWSKVHIYFGDERNVAVDHPDSNEGQARAALLSKVDIPAHHIHGYNLGETDMETSARKYEELITSTSPNGFDLHLLGMGYEGHINSLFPDTDAIRETKRLVIAVTDSPKPPPERTTLTLPAISRAERVWLLIAGEDKAEAASHVARRSPAEQWPAAGAEGRKETVMFLADNAAGQIDAKS
ncbi:6-phosphogluconolactonase [Corynebacterium cystitidis]|uniref:6-phosphogluconolactonase n=1 Tax=Corynebacterium cystitidis TaxID=35757 RepID=UPI00211DA795|nr:6-phosphogluconolactonase [Corynebacterium cystitidis]